MTDSPEPARRPTRDIRGVMGGTRLLDQPRYRAEVDRWRAFLATPGPALLEIGFDHGRRLTATADAHRAWRVAGLEVRERRVEEATAWAQTRGLDNLLAWRVDARGVLANHTPEARFQVIEALFPVPWDGGPTDPRLLIDRPWLDDAARALAPGGVLHIATDVAWYAAHIDALLDGASPFTRDPGAASDRPPIDALSRREWRCAREGVPIYRWWLRRTPRALASPAATSEA
jgi:tRNA (guanine-N7-)-methyltransferase